LSALFSFSIRGFERELTSGTHTDVGVIYIQKGIELLVYEFDDGTGQAGWFSVVVAVLFALSVYFIERAGTLPFGREFPPFSECQIQADISLVYASFLVP